MAQLYEVTCLSISILFCLPHFSLSLDPNFQAWKPRECGGLVIGYPFYIQGLHDPSCSFPGFQATCTRSNRMFINLPGLEFQLNYVSSSDYPLIAINTAGNHSDKARVLGINSSTHTMENALQSFLDPNPIFPSVDHTLNSSASKFSPSVGKLSLFYGFSSQIVGYHPQSFTCSYLNYIQVTGAPCYFSNTSETITSAIQYRNSSYIIPALESGLDELNHGNATPLNVVRKGFELKYTVNFTNSTKLSSGKPGSSEFFCNCPDGPQPLIYHTSGEKNAGLIPGLIASALGILILIALFIYLKRKRSTNNFTSLWTRGTMKNQNMEAFLKPYGSLAPKDEIFRYKDNNQFLER